MVKIIKRSPIYTGSIWKGTQDSLNEFIQTFPEYSFELISDKQWLRCTYCVDKDEMNCTASLGDALIRKDIDGTISLINAADFNSNYHIIPQNKVENDSEEVVE